MTYEQRLKGSEFVQMLKGVLKHKRYDKAKENTRNKLTAEQVKQIDQMYADGMAQSVIAKRMGVTQSMISRALNNGKAPLTTTNS